MEKYFSFIDENSSEYLSFWEEICNIEGTAFDASQINLLGDKIASFAEKEGFSVTKLPFDHCGDYVIIDTNPHAEKGVAFMAHTDTVHKIGAFGSPAVKREGDKLIGPGVIDCKGGIAIALLTMKALVNFGYDKNLRLLLTTDEEVSNRLSGEIGINAIIEAMKGYKAAFNCEVAREGEAVVSRKGVFRCLIEINGTPAHSGIDYSNGISAVREAAYKIIALESESNPESITYNCGIVEGGTRPNIVPDKCKITVDVRVKNGQSMEEAERFVSSVTEKSFVSGTKSTFTMLSRRSAMLHDDNAEALFNHLSSVSQKYGFGELTAIESGGGSDSAYSQLAGVPSICAVGACGDYCHTDKEFAYIRSLANQSKLLTAAIAEMK